MNRIFVILAKNGCDIKGALERTLNDEELLLDCINEVLFDPAFDELEKKNKAQDMNGAFDAAHTIKGICGNTGLIPLYNIICPIVEIFRAGQAYDAKNEIKELLETRDAIKELIK